MSRWHLHHFVIGTLCVTAVVGWWTVCCLVAAMTPEEAQIVAQRFVPLLNRGYWVVGAWVFILHVVASGLFGLGVGRWLVRRLP